MVNKMNDGYEEVLSLIGSSAPTPGGGSVAALTLSHAHSLAMMVSRLTEGKPKWSNGHEAAHKVIKSSSSGVKTALELAHEDAEAFELVMTSFKLPKGNQDEISFRNDAIESSTINAARVPLEIMRESCKFIKSIEELSMTGNSNALTDLLASSKLADLATNIASLNVKINLDSLQHNMIVNKFTLEMDELLLISNQKSTIIEENILERLKWN